MGNQEPQLLQAFAACRSDDAFGSLVNEYVGLVYAACFRQLKDSHLAEDAAQAVFLLLSRKAGTLREASPAGWLLTTSRYVCANMRKSRERRLSREQVVAMHPHTPAPDENNDLLELLDEALCHLRAGEREALVLRYLREESMGDVATMLGVSQAAARKRVDRGMEKLRSYFARRGIAATPAGLGVVLGEQVRGAMLPSMARQSITRGIIQVCHAGTQSTAASVAIAKETRRLMRITKIKSAAVAMTLAMALGNQRVDHLACNGAEGAGGAGRQCGGGAAAPSGAAAGVPAAALPATKPSAIDLSTPESALKSFFAALGDGDRAAAYQCLTADPHRPANLMDAMLAWDMAQSGLTRAAQQKYGDASRVQRMATLESVAQIIGYAPAAQIEGPAATITPFIPPQLIEVAPSSTGRCWRPGRGRRFHFRSRESSGSLTSTARCAWT